MIVIKNKNRIIKITLFSIMLFSGFFIYMFTKPKVLCDKIMNEDENQYYIETNENIPNFSIVINVDISEMGPGIAQLSIFNSDDYVINIYLINNSLNFGISNNNNIDLNILITINNKKEDIEIHNKTIMLDKSKIHEIGWIHGNNNRSELYINGKIQDQKNIIPNILKNINNISVLKTIFGFPSAFVTVTNARFCKNSKVSYF